MRRTSALLLALLLAALPLAACGKKPSNLEPPAPDQFPHQYPNPNDPSYQ